MKIFEIKNRKEGFTLTEVLIGMTILTIAIVAASNLMIGLFSLNELNLKSLQAYYLAQEGIESVRNIRDTNWLHNLDWLSEGSTDLWGTDFVVGRTYGVDLKSAGWETSFSPVGVADLNGLNVAAPWAVNVRGSGEILKVGGGGHLYLSSAGGGEGTGFKREIGISKYDGCDEGFSGDCDEDYVLVKSRVFWEDGADKGEVELEAVFSDWKGGVF